MKVGDLFPFVLTLVLIGVVLGVGINILDQLGSTSGLSANATASIQSTNAAMDDLNDWLPLIVLVTAAAIVIGLVIRSFRA